MWLRDFSLVFACGIVVSAALREFFVLLVVVHLDQEDLLSPVTVGCKPHTNTFSFMTRLQRVVIQFPALISVTHFRIQLSPGRPVLPHTNLIVELNFEGLHRAPG